MLAWVTGAGIMVTSFIIKRIMTFLFHLEQAPWQAPINQASASWVNLDMDD